MTDKPMVFITHPVPDEWVDPYRSIYQFAFGPAHVAGLDHPNDNSPEGISAVLSILSDPVREEQLRKFNNLQIVSNLAAGTDNIDLEYCRKNQIRVGNTPGVLTEATADLTLALLLCLSRKIIPASRDARDGKWKMWEPAGWLGMELKGSTLGIYGMGKIGQAVASRARSFGMRIIYNNRKPISADANPINAEFVEFDSLLKQSDVLSIHAPLNSESKGKFGRNEFQKMKPSSILLNIGRGAIVDTDGLADALENGWIHAAGLDVTNPEPLPPGHKLYKLENCLIVPHIGSATGETRQKMFKMAMENIKAGLEGKQLPYPVV